MRVTTRSQNKAATDTNKMQKTSKMMNNKNKIIVNMFKTRKNKVRLWIIWKIMLNCTDVLKLSIICRRTVPRILKILNWIKWMLRIWLTARLRRENQVNALRLIPWNIWIIYPLYRWLRFNLLAGKKNKMKDDVETKNAEKTSRRVNAKPNVNNKQWKIPSKFRN